MPKSAKTRQSQTGWCDKSKKLQFQWILNTEMWCSENATNQPKSTVELGF